MAYICDKFNHRSFQFCGFSHLGQRFIDSQSKWYENVSRRADEYLAPSNYSWLSSERALSLLAGVKERWLVPVSVHFLRTAQMACAELDRLIAAWERKWYPDGDYRTPETQYSQEACQELWNDATLLLDDLDQDLSRAADEQLYALDEALQTLMAKPESVTETNPVPFVAGLLAVIAGARLAGLAVSKVPSVPTVVGGLVIAGAATLAELLIGPVERVVQAGTTPEQILSSDEIQANIFRSLLTQECQAATAYAHGALQTALNEGASCSEINQALGQLRYSYAATAEFGVSCGELLQNVDALEDQITRQCGGLPT